MTYTLATKARTEKNTLKSLREHKAVPAVLYGVNTPNTQLELDEQAFRKVYLEAGENQLVNLEVEGKKPVQVLIREVQTHSFKDQIMHVDFYALDLDKPVYVEIPFHFSGVSQAVKVAGGSLLKRRDVLPVRTLPKDFVKFIDVPLDSLKNIGDVITISDIKIKDSWEVDADAEDVVATVLEPRLPEAETVVAPVAGAEGAVPVAGAEGAAAAAGTAGAAAPAAGGKPEAGKAAPDKKEKKK